MGDFSAREKLRSELRRTDCHGHSPLDKSQAEQLGASPYLFNPGEPDTLVAVVEASIMRAKDLKAG